jgi:hypothetical protein
MICYGSLRCLAYDPTSSLRTVFLFSSQLLPIPEFACHFLVFWISTAFFESIIVGSDTTKTIAQKTRVRPLKPALSCQCSCPPSLKIQAESSWQDPSPSRSWSLSFLVDRERVGTMRYLAPSLRCQMQITCLAQANKTYLMIKSKLLLT